MDHLFARCMFSTVGGVLLLVGLRKARIARRLERVGVRTMGKVVAIEGDSDGYYPIVEFDDRSGARHRVALSFHSSADSGSPVGSTMEVVYDPDKPDIAAAADFDPLMVPLLCGGMGFFTVVLAWLGEAGEG